MSAPLKALQTVGGVDKLYVDDVFQSFVRTGTGAEATVTLNPPIDLATFGGLLHTKCRGATAESHRLMSSAVGTEYVLSSNTTDQKYNVSFGHTFLSNGYSMTTSDASVNSGTKTYVDWVFRNAPNFYHHTVVTKTAGSNATFNFSMHDKGLGMVRVKRTDSSGSWYIWHRSLSAGKLLIGETTAAEATLGHITVSGTTVTLVNGVIADGTYLVEAFGHDSTTDGIIQCGSVTPGGGGIDVNLGWEPQFVILKQANGVDSWYLTDSMRGMGAKPQVAKHLVANSANAESQSLNININATGFTWQDITYGNWIYLTIRRPNKPPTSGTQVYNAIARTGTATAFTTVTGAGFAIDLLIARGRVDVGRGDAYWWDRMRGVINGKSIRSTQPDAEANYANSVYGFDLMDGYRVNNDFPNTSNLYINYFFRRAPGVHDQICYTGSGANKTEAHGLAAIPELWLVKGRSGTTEWVWGSSLLANTQKIVMPSPNGVVTDATAWNSTYPTASVISLGTAAAVNTSSATYSCWMWATLAGISKVGTFTGNGTNQTINCGFSAGARFVMIIRTTASTAQDVFIWDSARGIVAGNDPRLSLNTTAVEVTNLDTIDPDNSGFIVNQDASNVNVTGAVYLYLAYA